MSIQFRVSSELMEDQRLGAPLAVNGSFVTSRGPAGELDLFHLIDGRVVNVQRHAESPTGWQRIELPMAFDAGPLAADVDPADRKHVLFAAEENDFGMNLFVSVEAKQGQWGPWRSLDAGDHGPSNQRIKRLMTATLDGALQLFAVTGPRPNVPWQPDAVWRIAWNASEPQWTRLADTAGGLLAYANLARTGPGILISVESDDPQRGFDLVHFAAGSWKSATIATGLGFRLIAVDEQRNGRSIIVFDQADPGPRKELQYIDGDDPACKVEIVPGTSHLPIKQIISVDGKDLPFAIFLVDERNRLHVVNYDEEKDRWGAPLNLGFAMSHVSAGLNRQELPEIYGITAGAGEQRIQCIHRSPAGSWRAQTLSDPLPRRIEVRPVYTTEVLALDAAGAALPFTEVEIFASETIEAAVNHRTMVFGPSQGTKLQTDATGRLVLMAGSSTLNAPKWRVRRPADESDGTWIAVSDKVFGRMKTLSEENVRRILPESTKGQAKKVHEAITAAASFTPAALAAAAVPSGPYGLRPLPSGGPDGGWTFRVDASGVHFAVLTAEEAMARQRAVEANSERVLLDPFRWLGDLAQSLASGIAATADYLVTRIGGVVRATIDLVVDGVKFLFSGVIRFIEEVFQVIESVFNAVKAAFVDLFRYFGTLLADYRNDIWETKKLLQKQFTTTVDSIVWLLGRSRDGVDAYMRRTREDVRTKLDTVIDKIGTRTIGQRASPTTPPGGYPDAKVADSSAMVFALPRKAADPSADFEGGFTFTQAILDIFADVARDLDTFIKAIESSIGQAAKAQLDTIRIWFEEAAATPDKLLQTTFAALLQTLRNLIDLILSLTADVCRGLFDAAKTFFNAIAKILAVEVKSTLLQALYDLINPEAVKKPLTLGDLFFLLCAAPASLGHFVVFGRGLMAPAGPAGLAAGPAPGEPLDRILRRAAGFIRMVWGVFDLVLTNVSGLPGKIQFFFYLIPVLIRALLLPETIMSWTKADDVLRNVHWIIGSIPQVVRVAATITPVSEVIAAWAAMLTIQVIAMGVIRTGVRIHDGKFDPLWSFVWIAGPLSTTVAPWKALGSKAKAVVTVVKGGVHFTVGGTLIYLNQGE